MKKVYEGQESGVLNREKGKNRKREKFCRKMQKEKEKDIANSCRERERLVLNLGKRNREKFKLKRITTGKKRKIWKRRITKCIEKEKDGKSERDRVKNMC